jgi:hypothetical protein
MNARLLLTRIACTSELAVGQILFLSLQNDIFYFSRLSSRVAGMGLTAKGRFGQLIHAFATSGTVDQTE